MDAAKYSAMAAAISAVCALTTVYLHRTQGKGLVWSKDHSIQVLPRHDGTVHVQIDIPLFNFGKAPIRFLELKAKKINLETKAMENFSMDMDEAYFPEGVPIVNYRTAIHMHPDMTENQIVLTRPGLPPDVDAKEWQQKINESISNIPEHIIILKSRYKDGSWFGMNTKETVIGLSVKGLEITYLSTSRRKELNEFFAW